MKAVNPVMASAWPTGTDTSARSTSGRPSLSASSSRTRSTMGLSDVPSTSLSVGDVENM